MPALYRALGPETFDSVQLAPFQVQVSPIAREQAVPQPTEPPNSTAVPFTVVIA